MSIKNIYIFIKIIHLQTVEFRIRKLEELNEQTLAHLGVIHRFMATYMPSTGTHPGHHPPIAEPSSSTEGLRHLDVADMMRPRRVSERSETGMSEADSHSQLPFIPLKRKRLLARAMTDAAYLNMGATQQSSTHLPHPLHLHHEDQDEVAAAAVLSEAVEEVEASRENLSRNDSSVSGELNTLQDESKEDTSHDDSDLGKVVGEVIRVIIFKVF